MAAFIHFYHREYLPFNLWFAASAEEEISGRGGVELLLPVLGKVDCAIVGEPTQMQMAVAERGLLVVDCVAEGVAGHAARGEGINALYVALEDIERLRNYQFDKESTLLGPNQITVTVIETSNHQHNVVPSDCRFVLDIRLNEKTSFEEMLSILSTQLKSRFTPRSLRMRPSSIDVTHPLVQTGIMLGKKTYGSPTTSDVALLPFPALKMGPGDSARSHTANEYIYLEELRNGVEGMIHFLELFMKNASDQSNPTTLKGM